uniref:Uncharacterized protein n=1 Tax=Arundo donax TaxID=35708 RepID=A0A0A9EGF8_ARUDO
MLQKFAYRPCYLRRQSLRHLIWCQNLKVKGHQLQILELFLHKLAVAFKR